MSIFITPEQLSLFSVVQFPNDECTSSTTSPTTMGTCLTSSECTSRSGTGSGSCAAGFGVCCVVSTSTCGATVSTNITYIRNPGYPSSYTPTSAGTCSFTIDKASDDICQLRLDFETMSGYTATTAGACTASFQATGQAGKNPPAICGTNTDYHSKLSCLGMCLYSTFCYLQCTLNLEPQPLTPSPSSTHWTPLRRVGTSWPDR